jgi:hypothetical protein
VANSRTSGPILSGTASDSVRVLNVAYWVTNMNNGVITTANGLAALSSGTGSFSNWTIRTALMPGSNILAVRSSNYSGLASPVVSDPFFCKVKAPLELFASPEGLGKVTGVASVTVAGDAAPSNNAALCIGEGYTLTAKPALNCWLTNWMTNGVVAGSNMTLNFIMESNLTVTANFASNLFVPMAARYDGIFHPSPPVAGTAANSGLIENLVLKTNGVYSAKLYLAGTNYPIAGAFDRSGRATETIAAEGGMVTLELNIPWHSVPRQITGWVQGTNSGGWISSNLFLCAATTNRYNPRAFTMLLPQNTNFPGSPPSYGYALITNNGSIIALGGALSDGAAFSRAEPVNEANEFPVFASLYNHTGLLLGQLSLDDALGAAPAGNLAWFKPPSQTGLYTNGFNTTLAVQGSPWTNTASALGAFTTNRAQLTLSGGGLASNLVFTLQLTSTDILRLLDGPDNFSAGSINRINGLMSLTFTNTAGSKVSAFGTVLQNTNLGGGFFPGATNTGTFKLQP